jgi:hypothetical protein
MTFSYGSAPPIEATILQPLPCSLLKVACPEQLTVKVPVEPGVLPSSEVFIPFSNRRGRNYVEWPVLPHFWLFLR